jgi:hypothetical protein
VGQRSILSDAEPGTTVDTVALQVQRTVTSDDPDGTFAVTVVDAAGNAATLDLDKTIVVDRTAPDAPLPSSLTLRRFPWGDAVNEDAHVDVDGVAVTDEADAIVGVTLGSGSIVQGVVDDAGAFAVSVAGDSESAQVVVVDAAGNVSAPAPVDAVFWQATMHKNVVGSVFENPHVMVEVPRFGPFLTTPLDREVRAPGRAALNDDRDVVGGTGLTLDVQTFVNAEPRIRRRSLIARDPRTGRVLFTGGTFQTGIDDTAVYAVDDFGHIAVVGQSNRPTRRDSAFALDQRRGVFVSFGGATGTATLDETFESEDGITWRERVFDEAPPPRTFAAAAYDADRAAIVLFGGQNGTAFFDDTWLYDGDTWTQLDSPTRPSPRSSTALAHLPGLGVVLFGGLTAAGVNGETWLLGESGWELLRPSAPPSARTGAAFAYDVDADALLLFGGDTNAAGSQFGSAVNETWHFDGERYVQRNPRTSPQARLHTSLATDVAGGRVFLVGGEFDEPQIGAASPATTTSGSGTAPTGASAWPTRRHRRWSRGGRPLIRCATMWCCLAGCWRGCGGDHQQHAHVQRNDDVAVEPCFCHAEHQQCLPRGISRQRDRRGRRRRGHAQLERHQLVGGGGGSTQQGRQPADRERRRQRPDRRRRQRPHVHLRRRGVDAAVPTGRGWCALPRGRSAGGL